MSDETPNNGNLINFVAATADENEIARHVVQRREAIHECARLWLGVPIEPGAGVVTERAPG